MIPLHSLSTAVSILESIFGVESRKFLEWLKANYMTNTTGIFSPQAWNQYDNIIDLSGRTNNFCEGSNRELHSLLGSSRPSITKCLDLLRKNEDLQALSLEQMSDPLYVNSRSLALQQDCFSFAHCTVLEYMKKMSAHIVF